MASEERLRELEEKYEGYTVYDNAGSKIGKVDDLFVDERDNEEYIGVKMGFFGTKSTLIPTEIVRINESDRTIEVSESKDHVKNAPNFSDDDDVTREYEERIRSHFGLESLGSGSDRGGYSGEGAGSSTAGGAAAGAASTTSDHDDDRDRGYSDQGSSSYDSGDRDRESSGHDTRDDTRSSSEVDTDYGERRDSGTATAGSAGAAEHQSSGESSSGAGGYTEERGSSGDTGSQHGDSGTSGTSEVSSSGESSSGSKPSTTRQTEETETFQEGGRTKIRRRIIREEVVDADDPGTSSQ
jgi:sporulation protein YlmC with PRC-barrel domain